MKNISSIALLAAVVVLSGLYFRETQKARESDQKVAVLQKNLDELQARLDQQETRAASLQTRLKDTRERVVAIADEVTHLQEAITNRAETDKNPMNEMVKGVGEMFKNKDMKEFVKAQQKTMLSGMLEKAYAPLCGQLGLSTEQSAALKDLVVNKSLVDAGAGMTMMSETESTNRTQIIEQTKIEKEAIDLQIKQMLGEDNYKQFQGYEKSLPDRMALGMFKDQQGTGPTALTPDQEAQLIQLMGEERQSFKFTTDFSDQNKLSSDLAGNFTEEKVAQFLQEQEQLHQRYANRAQTVLSSEQYGSFEKFLSSQRQMQSLGLKMASKMFAPKGN